MLIADVYTGIAGLLLTVGTPLLVIVVLIRNRSTLKQPDTIVSYGFLYRGFAYKEVQGSLSSLCKDPGSLCFLWEPLILIRKAGLVVLVQILAVNGVFVQATAATMWIFIWYMLHELVRPYNEPQLHALERVSLCVVLSHSH